jgi:heme-degrading monooxygenase HmoA
MIYELRHYFPVPGKEEAILNRFQSYTFKIFDRRGFKVHDFWVEANGSGHLWYVLEWQSAEQMKSEW